MSRRCGARAASAPVHGRAVARACHPAHGRALLAGLLSLLACVTGAAPPRPEAPALPRPEAPAAAQPRQPPADRPAALDSPPDFREVLHLAEVYASVRHDSTTDVLARWGPYYSDLTLVSLSETRNRYLLGTVAATGAGVSAGVAADVAAGTQEIVIRGTANFRNALYDAEVAMRYDPELGIRVHRGFDAMAHALYDDLAPRLDRSRDIVLYGHSLGAAEAVVLALMLRHDGYRLRRVYASGQPKITDRAGAERYAAFPVLRISCEDDPVPFLPPRVLSLERPYVHFGPEIILLDGPYYTVAGDRPENATSLGSLWKLLKETGAREALGEHMIGSYIARLEGKDRRAIEVPYADRGLYLHDHGTGPSPGEPAP